MYAVIKTGGKQYKVRVGDAIEIEKLETGVGEEITFDYAMRNYSIDYF